MVNNEKWPCLTPLGIRRFLEVIEQIPKAVFKGKLEPVDRLPSEKELFGEFNVIKTILREA